MTTEQQKQLSADFIAINTRWAALPDGAEKTQLSEQRDAAIRAMGAPPINKPKCLLFT